MSAESLKYIYLICPNVFVDIEASSSYVEFNAISNTVCLTCLKHKL